MSLKLATAWILNCKLGNGTDLATDKCIMKASSSQSADTVSDKPGRLPELLYGIANNRGGDVAMDSMGENGK